MITKITSANADLYYAPRFAQITEAFKAAGSSIEIHSLEDYFVHLLDIAQLQVGAKNIPEAYLLVLPADEEIFTIDANTRAINIPTFVKKNGIGVYGDHRAEMIVMTIDRYFDHEDFLNDKIVINWNFTPSGAKTPVYEENQAAAAFAPNEELNPGYITFGFIITKEMTPSKGTLNFSVTIYDEKSEEIVYSFNTLTVSVTINDTLTLTDPKIVKNDSPNYVGRLVNSVYVDNTISPVSQPVWKSGDFDAESETFSGLPKFAYFATDEDLANVYSEGALLKAYAVTVPNTADTVYKWSYNPLDGTVDMGRDFSTENLASDYVDVDELIDNEEYYYVKDALGHVQTIDPGPLTYAQAVELLEAAENNAEPFLDIQVKKLVTAPNDVNKEASQFNQNKLEISSQGNLVLISSKEELNSFASTNEAQGSGQWIGIDIDTGLESIVGALWNGYPLTMDDVNEAASVGLGAGHIIFWAKADALLCGGRTITISADGYRTTSFIVKYLGVDSSRVGINGYTPVVCAPNSVKFVVRGSSFRALTAGSYQVVAQSRISAGKNYEKFIGTEEQLVVNKLYYKKLDENTFDEEHPVSNENAVAALQNGEELYVLVSAARNSEPIESSALTVPPALQPEVVLSVASEYDFEDENNGVERDPDWEGEEYVYIDDSQMPRIIATVTIPSDNSCDKAGAFAAQLIESDAAPLDLAAINEGIDDESLVFSRLPAGGQFEFNPQTIKEGSYVVRAVNRRNATYSVSEPSDVIVTSFVAPAVNKLTVSGAMWDLDTDRPTAGFVKVLDQGQKPKTGDDESSRALINLEISRVHPRYSFKIVNETEIDDSKYKVEDIATSFYIEEVEYDTSNDVVTPRTPDENGNDPETGRPYEPSWSQVDLREVVLDENDMLVFDINDDPGYYRIKVVSRYHGTIHTSYTDVFGVVSH